MYIQYFCVCMLSLTLVHCATYSTNPADKSNAHLKTLKTEAGTNLLISGWWGM